MDVAFCLRALEEALARFGKPEIFNTDQGSQFTSGDFTGMLTAAGIRISMDGRGRWIDNVFIERLWRSLKYEDIYLRGYADGREARAGIGEWLAFYNRASQHPSVYVIDGNRICCSGGDPAGCFGLRCALSEIARAAWVASAARLNIQGPSGRGWRTSISPASADKRRVFGAIPRNSAALLRFNHGSTPSSARL
jgi:hypothetical protein